MLPKKTSAVQVTEFRPIADIKPSSIKHLFLTTNDVKRVFFIDLLQQRVSMVLQRIEGTLDDPEEQLEFHGAQLSADT